MILDKYVKIKMNKQNIKKYEKILNISLSVGDIIDYPIDKLPVCSHYKINVKCDVCGHEKIITYQKYNINFNNYKVYTCNNKCAQIKNINTSIKKYGIEHYSKTKYFKDIVTNYDNIITYSRENMNMVEKIKETKLKKYGDENYTNIDKFKETCIVKYGVDNPSKVKEFQDKWKQTNLKKYGYENVFQNEKIKEKIKETNISKYGVEYPSQSEEIINKILKTSNREIKYDIGCYKNYRIMVCNHTKKNKKKLFECWNGYDYYDNEYIKDNFSLNSTDKKYPTIDHKFSIIYCFLNNISIENCANIDNLCITTKSNNSSKNRKTENEYINNSL